MATDPNLGSFLNVEDFLNTLSQKGASRSNSGGAKQKAQLPKPENFRYLVLEGGGGKGFAYLGALKVIEKLQKRKPHPMPQFSGFGGASAGAITALLLSMGMNSGNIEEWLSKNKFTDFFDPAFPRRRPEAGNDSPGEIVEGKWSKEERTFIGDPSIENFVKLFANDVEQIKIIVLWLLWLQGLNKILARSIGEIAKLAEIPLLEWSKSYLLENPPVGDILLKDIRHYLAFLPRDMGFFSGRVARNVLHQLLIDQVKEKNPELGKHFGHPGGWEPYDNRRKFVSFKQHWDTFHTKLLVTGTNLVTGKTELFSKDDTPEFPVADAIRISMGLPFVFKPYVIKNEWLGHPPCGVYVDGGVWNNLPYREFDADAQREARQANKPFIPATLGLRLEIDPPATINSVLDIAEILLLQKGLLGSGETQVLNDFSSRAIILDTRGLDLLNFDPDNDTRAIVNKRSARQTWRYFGMDYLIPDDDKDDIDDMISSCLRASADPCSTTSFVDCVAMSVPIDPDLIGTWGVAGKGEYEFQRDGIFILKVETRYRYWAARRILYYWLSSKPGDYSSAEYRISDEEPGTKNILSIKLKKGDVFKKLERIM